MKKLFHVEHIAQLKNPIINKLQRIVPRGTYLIMLHTITITGCLTTKQPEEQALNNILSSFIHKTPNQIYEILGKPDDYSVVSDKHNHIQYATITYKYIYNFVTHTYDCNVNLITDAEQDEIVDTSYSSPRCLYITSF